MASGGPADGRRAETSRAELPALAEAEPDFAGFWVDQFPDQPPYGGNDPTRLVVNVRFTGDLERHERELRKVWGGALCVSQAERTQAELEPCPGGG